MAIKWVKGKTRIREYPRKSSTTFSKNSLVNWVNGLVQPADATSGNHVGICVEDVASTDDDFDDSAVSIKVEVPADKQCVMEADVGSGTLATTSVGEAFDLSDALNVNQSAQSKKVVTCVGFISSSKGLFVLNATYDVADVATT